MNITQESENQERNEYGKTVEELCAMTHSKSWEDYLYAKNKHTPQGLEAEIIKFKLLYHQEILDIRKEIFELKQLLNK